MKSFKIGFLLILIICSNKIIAQENETDIICWADGEGIIVGNINLSIQGDILELNLAETISCYQIVKNYNEQSSAKSNSDDKYSLNKGSDSKSISYDIHGRIVRIGSKSISYDINGRIKSID